MVQHPAGQDVSIATQTEVQNLASVISEVGVFMMPGVKFSAERRQQKRFKAAEGAFAALVDQESRLGQIKDISIRGLSFRYIDSNDKLENAKELKIILGRKGLYLDKLPFKKISDFEIKSEFSFSRVKMRQIGLEFGKLTSEQRLKLNRFIQYHTVGETQ